MYYTILEKNKDFIAEETIEFLRKKFKNYIFNYELLRRDIHMIVDIFMGELRMLGGVYSHDIMHDRDDSYYQLNRYKKSFTTLKNHNEETIEGIKFISLLIEKIIKNEEIKNILNDKFLPYKEDFESHLQEQNFDLETITSLIIFNCNTGSLKNYHIEFIEEYFDKGFVVTKIPENIHKKMWEEVRNTNWVDAKKTTYKKVPDWYHENEKHYVDPTGSDRPDYEKKIGSDIFTNAPKSLIDISNELIKDPLFDPLKMYRPPNPVTKYLHFWNGSENSPHHVDSIDGSDLMIFCYLTDEKEWKQEWGGYINIMKQVNSEVTNSKIILPNDGVMVLVNNSSPIFKHGIRNLVKKDVNRYTFIFHYTWTY